MTRRIEALRTLSRTQQQERLTAPLAGTRHSLDESVAIDRPSRAFLGYCFRSGEMRSLGVRAQSPRPRARLANQEELWVVQTARATSEASIEPLTASQHWCSTDDATFGFAALPVKKDVLRTLHFLAMRTARPPNSLAMRNARDSRQRFPRS